MNHVLAILAYRKRGPERPTANDAVSLIDRAVQTLVGGEPIEMDAVTISQPVSSAAQGEAFRTTVEDAASVHHLFVETTIGHGRVRVRLSRRASPQEAPHGRS